MIVTAIGAVAVLFEALNGFADFTKVQPFATKAYVSEMVQAAENELDKKYADSQKDVQDRLVNLQMMSLEEQLQIIDGQLETRRTEQVDMESKILKDQNDTVSKRRLTEIEGNIGDLVSRRTQLSCYLDALRGLRKTC